MDEDDDGTMRFAEEEFLEELGAWKGGEEEEDEDLCDPFLSLLG